MLALLLRWSGQLMHGRRCRWCGLAGVRVTTCSSDCREQLSAFWEPGS